MHDVEAIVVGGGPAGSTFATALAQAGHRVLLLDKGRFPRHKACSDYLNPAGAHLLAEMGVIDDARQRGASRMKGMVVHAPDGGRFVADYERAEAGRAALGLTRFQLDALLLDRARAAGVTVHERAHVRDILQTGGVVTGVVATIDGVREELRARLVVGADGRHSVVARSLGLSRPLTWPRKTGLSMHYRGVTGLDQYGEMHIARDVYAGLAILEDGLTNVTLVARTPDVQTKSGSLEDFITRSINTMPGIATKLQGAERVGSVRGVGSMACRSRRPSGDGYLLIGDAASFLDPFAGEGIHEALRGGLIGARVASAALRSGDVSARALADYRAARRRAFSAKRAVSWIVQGFINAPAMMNYVTPRLADRGDVGMTISGVLGGFRPATEALSPRFLAQMLRP